MANPIRLKRSSTAGKIPVATTDLLAGEMGLNTADNVLYIHDGTRVRLVNTERYNLYPHHFDLPATTDWAVNGFPSIITDSLNNALTVAAFDGTLNEGIGFLINIPAGAQNIRIRMRTRAATAPASTLNAVMNFYRRVLPNNAAMGTWSTAVAINTPVMANTQYTLFEQVFTLASLNLTANTTALIELVRNGASASDTLVGDLLLSELQLEVM